ncbi:hypothetical protein AWU65_22005 [Paenibacillus glucanolyticus]|uniref:HNH endonuclease n=1 Tax=Paenibacillus glucanolyticus TaxID=59843 RepID=A0A163LSG5_9BACL|nr:MULTISPECIES: hypothetical protein [Paenibacillus]KZS48417.1 hypothetical protein AWU65_22005 [Paenibacillus glucanolyticus]MDH6672283.1 hypothetical protein [Paenibacillus sp. LBL]
MRDSFSLRITKIIADRAGHRCSNPVCRRATSKAHPNDPELSVNLGIAAHITAASPNGPRYDQRLTTDERKSASNGIWVCTRCSKEIDSAESAYSVDLLRRWKKDIEVATARDTVEIEAGKLQAYEYQNVLQDAFEVIFSDQLFRKRSEVKVNEGRKRIDVVFSNESKHGFFLWIKK